MVGIQTRDGVYEEVLWVPKGKQTHMMKEDSSSIWHQRLRHDSDAFLSDSLSQIKVFQPEKVLKTTAVMREHY